MCRLIAYLGPPVGLDRLILAPEHSLLVQAHAPREMTDGTINADGFGMAWWDDRRAEPYVYRSTLPIWADSNLPHLAAYAASGRFMAAVRGATPGQGTDSANTPPFANGRLAAIHNGCITDFRAGFRRNLRTRLSPEAEAAILGTTDSEHLFAWLLTHLPAAKSLDAALERSLAALAEIAPGAAMTLNLVVSDGERLVASRMAHRARAPSLYWLSDHPRFPGGVIIASEPLFGDAAWQGVPENSMVSVGPDRSVNIRSLAH